MFSFLELGLVTYADYFGQSYFDIKVSSYMNCYTFKYKVEGRGFSFLSVLTIDKANNAVEFYRQPLQKTGEWNRLTFVATADIVKVKVMLFC